LHWWAKSFLASGRTRRPSWTGSVMPFLASRRRTTSSLILICESPRTFFTRIVDRWVSDQVITDHTVGPVDRSSGRYPRSQPLQARHGEVATLGFVPYASD